MLLNIKDDNIRRLTKNEFLLSIPINQDGGTFGDADIRAGDVFKFESEQYTIETVLPEYLPGALAFRVTI